MPENPSPFTPGQIVIGFAPFAAACLAVISTGWLGQHPLAGGLVLLAGALVTLVGFAALDPAWRGGLQDDAPGLNMEPTLHKKPTLRRCAHCGSAAVERRVDRQVNPRVTIIACRKCGATSEHPFQSMLHCDRCGADRLRRRTERVRCPPWVIHCRACGAAIESWSEYAGDRCKRCSSEEIRKTNRPRYLVTWVMTCRDCRNVMKFHERSASGLRSRGATNTTGKTSNEASRRRRLLSNLALWLCIACGAFCGLIFFAIGQALAGIGGGSPGPRAGRAGRGTTGSSGSS